MASLESTAERNAGEQNLITFRLGEQIYGLPIEPIERIIPMVTITPIPQIEGPMEGVINVRGKAVPVVSLRCHLGMEALPLQTHTPILLVWVDKLLVGLIVDTVIDMLTLPPQRIARPDDIIPAGLEVPSILQGFVHLDGKTVLILNVDHLFLPEEKQALTRAIASIETQLEEMAREDELVKEDVTEEGPDGERLGEEVTCGEELAEREPNEEDISEEEPDAEGEIES